MMNRDICDMINWLLLLAFVTGAVNQDLLLQNEYLAAENRILRCHLPTRLRLRNAERWTLAEIGKRLGRKRLKSVACTAQPDTIAAWFRRLIARKFDGCRYRASPGRPRVEPKVEALVIRLAKEQVMTGQRTDAPTSVKTQEQCDALAERIAAVLPERKKLGDKRRRRRYEFQRQNEECTLARHYTLRDGFRIAEMDLVYATIMASNAAI